MTKIRVLFYRPDLDGHLLDNLIAIWTWIWNMACWLTGLITSHVEIWIPDEAGDFMPPSGTVEGQCYTSTMGQAGGKNRKGGGTCCRPASEILKNPHRWFYTEIETTETALDYAVKWAETAVANNKGYDKKDIAKYFLPIRKQNVQDNKFICSGFCWAFIFKLAVRALVGTQQVSEVRTLYRLIGGKEINMLPSPVRLAMWMKKAGFRFYALDGKEIK